MHKDLQNDNQPDNEALFYEFSKYYVRFDEES